MMCNRVCCGGDHASMVMVVKEDQLRLLTAGLLC